MEREEILAEARSLASQLGEAPTIRQFREQTGIKDSWWKGRYFARWSELLADAGLEAKSWKTNKLEPDLALRKYWELASELGSLPVEAQMKLRKRTDPEFPNPSSLRKHFGSELVLRALENAKGHGASDHVLDILRDAMVKRLPQVAAAETDPVAGTGFVYLMKSGKHYKIGKTNSPDRRQYEIGLQLPQGLERVHSIETDDPSGIETYWHNRFKDKRLNGEWFDLSAEDVRAFKRRRSFM